VAKALHEPLVFDLTCVPLAVADRELVSLAMPVGVEDGLLEGGTGEVVPSFRDVWVGGPGSELSFEFVPCFVGEGVATQAAVVVEPMGEIVEPVGDGVGPVVGQALEGAPDGRHPWFQLRLRAREGGSLLTAIARALVKDPDLSVVADGAKAALQAFEFGLVAPVGAVEVVELGGDGAIPVRQSLQLGGEVRASPRSVETSTMRRCHARSAQEVRPGVP
jgi:hypothetical protein